MKQVFVPTTHRKPHHGFTLVETVIAMGIITIMITAFLAAFGPAVKGIKKSITSKEANRLATTLEYELSVIRYNEENSSGSNYKTKFEKSFEWIKESGGTNKNQMVLIYQYRGDPDGTANDDGTLKPYTEDLAQAIPGQDYVLQSVVRRLGDDEVEPELQPGVVEGRVFYVRMAQLVFDNGELKVGGENGAPGGLGQIIDPTEPRDTVTDYLSYPDATIAFQARFYAFKSNTYPYIDKAFELTDSNGDGHPDALGKPIFVSNMAVRR